MGTDISQLPVGADVSVTHPLFDGVPGWLTDGSVGLAKAELCQDDGGKLKVNINFVPVFVTGREAAAFLRVSRTTVRRLVERGKLEVEQFGTERRITWQSLLICAGVQDCDPANFSS